VKKVQGLAVSKVLFAALSMGLILAGIAQAQIPTFTGKFTLTHQVQWSRTVLQPGDYTVTIAGMSAPTFVLIGDASGRPVAYFLGQVDDGKATGGNALLVGEKDGRQRVYALALADLKKMLVYDRAMAKEEVTEAHAPQTVPVTLAKR